MQQDFSELVERLHREKEYRPGGVAVCYKGENSNPEFLAVQSAKNHTAWYLPQGGIRPGETLEQNLSRELGDELGIVFARDIAIISPAYHFETLDAEAGRKDKRGFAKGKGYIFTLCRYEGDSQFVLKPDELNAAVWCGYDKALGLFYAGRKEKADQSRRALDKAISILGR